MRIRFTIGGDRISDYKGKVSTPIADLATVKCLSTLAARTLSIRRSSSQVTLHHHHRAG
jgi:hypothetical protein